jgi:hypothetical protein
MKRLFFCLFFFFGVLIFIPASNLSIPDIHTQMSAAVRPQSLDSQNSNLKVDLDFGRMPLYFIRNQGQLDKQVAFYVQGRDKTLYFTSEGVTFVLSESDSSKTSLDSKNRFKEPMLKEIKQAKRWVVKLDFVDATTRIKPVGQDKAEAIISYFKGKPEEWYTGLSTYSKIVYSNLWPGIDLVYCGTANRLKYEFIVHPGADPSQIRLAYRGATSVSVGKEGRLEVMTPAGSFQDDVPVAWQENKGRRVNVPLQYKTEKTSIDTATLRYGFDIGDYDPTKPLILDPAVLVYCGYIGGSQSDSASGIALDKSGNAYITGSTESNQTSFPVKVGPDLTHNSSEDAFVAKVKADGTTLVYCGYIGGSGGEGGSGIAVDGSGNAYITGSTYSYETSFPVKVGPYLYFGGEEDVFVAKVNASGTALVYCGYIGTDDFDVGNAIAVDGSGNAYITGYTSSSSFHLKVGPSLTFGGYYDAFVAKVNATGSALVYCGYIGGAEYDYGNGIAVDGSGNAYITGSTESDQTSFPVKVGPDLTFNYNDDAFVAKVNAAGTSFVYCGYIGGNISDRGNAIAVDGSGNAYITGETQSYQTSFPVKIGPDLTYNYGQRDAFVAKVNASGAALSYCGYIGGAEYDYGNGIAVDGSGNAYITGYTASDQTSFPVKGGPDLTFNGGDNDVFVAKVNATGSALVYCGYIGGSATAEWPDESEYGASIAVDGSGNAYITGGTKSDQTSFPVKGGPDLTFNGGDYDAFVAKISYFMKNDFNGDGQEDILWRYYSSGGANTIWYMKGVTHTGSASLSAVTDLNWKIVGTGDFNGDGWPDILWRHYLGGNNAVWYMKGASYLGAAYLSAVTDLNWQIVGTGDFNGDGWPDILWRHYLGGNNTVWYMKGVTHTGSASLSAVTDLNWKIVGTGDFNGDGWPDILWRHYLGGSNVVWYMKGVTHTGSASLSAVTDLNWKIVGTGDFNGDGWPDILWRYNGSGGNNAVWYMKGVTHTGSASLSAVTDLNWRIENH